MPWTKKQYPNAMKNLPRAVREKSIAIANALVDENRVNEGIAIATAISRAKDWAVNHGKSIEPTSADAKVTDAKVHGEDRYVIPYDNASWAIKKEGADKIEKAFRYKQDAVKQARKEARKANASLTIQKQTGQVQNRISYNPNKRIRKTS